ncbi:hypothetical protein [Pimelobacter sp. 30-1]|uniref:hypothetical protein n=1 Tax=Pimelobacter sp. 30-1 TaxID=2004991 RepID=UPI001C05BCFE|nr:hypothetical protein [Pimelobacter sp. 30-1]MBU2693952.1 hypothetical protein [Pimelobacter sp. 30-1]
MTSWIDSLDLPERWIDLRRRRDRVARRTLVARHRRELRREIAPGHVLHGRAWEIIGLGVPARDDALLRLSDGAVALVHLTWGGAQEPPSWPMTVLVTSVDELRAELEDRGYEWDEVRAAPTGRPDPYACVVDGELMWSLLRSLDDPDHLEVPSDFDHSATRKLFDELVGRLDAAFACRTNADRHVEDASLHARVSIPSAATETGEPLVVSVSNFGSLATVAVTNPGAYSQDEFKERLAARDAARIYATLDSLGYQVVPEAPLWNDYDGPSALAALDARHGATWWTRFFDYL